MTTFEAKHRLTDWFRQWRDPLRKFLLGRTGVRAADVEDVGQEVFLAVHRGIGRFDPSRPNATFRGWLWTITRNAVLQWRRRGEHPAAGGTTAMGRLNEVAELLSGDSDVDPPSSPDETASLLHRALGQIRPTIEPQTWAAFWRTTVLGQPAPEVAAELGMSAVAVRQAKSRLLRRLRRQLGDQ